MADDQATFEERFTGQPTDTTLKPGTEGNTFANPQYAEQYAAEQFKRGNYLRGIAGGLGAMAAGGPAIIADLFSKAEKAFFSGLTPAEEMETGVNGALLEMGAGTPFKAPKGTAAAFNSFHEQVTQPAAERLAVNPTDIEPVRGSDVPQAVARSQLALTGEPHVDAVLNSPITKNVIDNTIVDRTHDVPYTAGGSVPLQDPTMFVDKNFPRAFNIDGKVFDPADPFTIHENVEQHAMDILTKGGMTSDEAYRVAHFEFAEKAEGAWYRAHGIDQDKAEAAYAPYMAAIQHDQGANFPPNLYDRPYPHDAPSAAKHEAIAEPRPSSDEISRAKQIIADWQIKQAGEIAAYHGTAAEVDFGINFDVMEGTNKGERGVSFFSPTPGAADVYTGVNARARERISAAQQEIVTYQKQMREKYGTRDWQPKATIEDRQEYLKLFDAEKAARETPEGAPGPRIIPVRIKPGKTETFDVAKLFGEGDKQFHEAYREVGTNPELGHAPPIYKEYAPEERQRLFNERLEELQRSYRAHEERRASLLEETKNDEGGPRDIGPWKAPLDLIAPAVHLAKQLGLDTARIINLAEHGEQIIVLNPKQIQPRYTPSPNMAGEARDLGVIGPDRSIPRPKDTPAQAAQRAIPAAGPRDDKISMTPAGEPIDAWEARFKQWVKDLKSPEEVKPFIEQSAAKNNNFPEARAGYVNPAHVEALAETAGVDPTTIDRGKLTSLFNNPDKIRMAKQLLDTTLDNFREAAAKVATDASEQNMTDMLAAEIKRDYALEQILGLRAEWGRAGHALRDLLQKVEGENKVSDLLKSKGRTPEDMRDLARGIADMDSASAARTLSDMRGKQPHWFYWTWVQGLISGPFTHAKYFLANALYAATERGVVTPLAAMLGKFRATPDKVFLGEGPAMMWGTLNAVPDAVRAAYETVKSGVRVPLESELELRERAEAAGEKLPKEIARAVNPVTQMGRPIPGIWGRIIGAPGDMAGAIHTVFKVLGERANLEAWAYNKAAAEGLGPADQVFWDRYAFHKANPTDQALKDSVYQAYKDTFMQPLGPKAEAFQSAMKGNPIGRWIIPFAHIPINLMKATYEYSPFAFLDKDMRANILGENGGRVQDMAIARMTVGSAVMGYFVHKYMLGQANGAYPRDPKERAEWTLMGKIPNSVQIGDRWVSFERFGPAGGLAGMGADIGSLITHSDKADPENWTKLTWLAANAAANIMADAPGFQSIRNIFEALTEYQQGARFASWEAGSLLPFSSLVTQTASFLDPQMRQARTFLDGLLYRMPGMREDLAPKRDPLYGEPVTNPGYGNIIRKAPVQQDPAKAALDKIGYYPHAPGHEIGGVKLTPEQYDKYQATAGPLVKQALTSLVSSPQWRVNGPQWQTQVAKEMIAAARRRAATAVQLDDPSLVLAGRERRLKQVNGAQ